MAPGLDAPRRLPEPTARRRAGTQHSGAARKQARVGLRIWGKLKLGRDCPGSLLLRAVPSLLALAVTGAAALPALAQQAREPQLVVTGTVGAPDGISLASENDDLSALLFRDSGNHTIWLRTSDGTRPQLERTRSAWTTTRPALRNRVPAIPWSSTACASTPLGSTSATAPTTTSTSPPHSTAARPGVAANIRLDDSASAGARDVKDFRIASSGNDVVALLSVEDTIEELYLTWSNDGGATWEDAVEVSSHNGVGDIDDIALAASADRAYIAWRDNFTNGVDDSVWFAAFDLKNGNFVAQDLAISPNMVAAGGDADNERRDRRRRCAYRRALPRRQPGHHRRASARQPFERPGHHLARRSAGRAVQQRRRRTRRRQRQAFLVEDGRVASRLA